MTEERILDALYDLDEYDLIDMWNEYCGAYGCYEDEIMMMDEFDDMMSGRTPTDIISSLDEDFDVSDEFFQDTMWGLKSFNDAYDVVDFDALTQYIYNNNDSLGCSEIEELLEEDEDDEMEDA